MTRLSIFPKEQVRKRLRLCWIAGLLGVSIYLLLLLLLFAAQDWLIFPGRWSAFYAGAPQYSAPEKLVEIDLGDAGTARGLFFPAGPRAAGRPALLYFYGNGSCLAEEAAWLRRMNGLGYPVLCLDYPGYGMSRGAPSVDSLRRTALAAYDYAAATAPGDGPPLVVGRSLGGAVAVDLASRRPVSGLLLFSTFTSLQEVCSRTMPWAPVAQLLRHRWESSRAVRRVQAPVLIVHGDRDRLVPPDMARTLAAAAGERAELIEVPGADHNDVRDRGGPDLDRQIARFLAEASQPEESISRMRKSKDRAAHSAPPSG